MFIPRQVYCQQILSIFVCLEKSLFLLKFWRIISQGTEFWVGVFPSQYFKYLILFYSCLLGWFLSRCHIILCSSLGKVSFFWLLSGFLFLIFCSLTEMCLVQGSWIFFGIYSLVLEFPGSMVWCLTLVWGNSLSLLFQILYSFSLSSPHVLGKRNYGK